MKTLYMKNRGQWRAWLEKNHAKEKEVILAYYKKATGKPCITYEESVEEALCFGWIDGVRGSLDEERHTVRFTPRRPGSIWSKLNRERVEKMIADGKMTEAGMKPVEEAKRSGKWDEAYRLREGAELPPDLEKALKKNRKAWEFFNTLSNSNRFAYIHPVKRIKGKALREEKIRKVVELCEQHIKPHVNGKRSLRS